VPHFGLFLFFLVSVSLVFRGRTILTRACATAASFFLVAHSSSVRTFPETLHFAVFFFFLLLLLHTISLRLLWDVRRLDKTHARSMLLSEDSKQVL
jgi:hypothetical protein